MKPPPLFIMICELGNLADHGNIMVSLTICVKYTCISDDYINSSGSSVRHLSFIRERLWTAKTQINNTPHLYDTCAGMHRISNK